jgi:hypothetical protein
MQALEPFQDDVEGTLFRDVVMLALAGFVAIVVLRLPHLAPPGAGERETAVPPGNVLVEIRCPDGSDADVDLWVQAPGDRPVGCSNRGGAVFDLLRDDLGRRGDATPLNCETAYARGAPGGEHSVNLHLDRAASGATPIPVEVTVSARPGRAAGSRQLLARKVVLTRQGEEVTVARFRLDPQGELVAGSIHALTRLLRHRQEGTARSAVRGRAAGGRRGGRGAPKRRDRLTGPAGGGRWRRGPTRPPRARRSWPHGRGSWR